MAARTNRKALVSVESVSRALEILRVLEPKRAATFDSETNTVRVMKKTYNRRGDGTIIGANSGNPEGWWVETRVDVCEAASRALTKHNSARATDEQHVKTLSDFVASDERELAEVVTAIEQLGIMPESLRTALLPTAAAKRDVLETRITERLQQIESTKQRLAGMPVV